ncbi:hypothetical protein MHYP_G00301910 [Metynnis hypsauchen]
MLSLLRIEQQAALIRSAVFFKADSLEFVRDKISVSSSWKVSRKTLQSSCESNQIFHKPDESGDAHFNLLEIYNLQNLLRSTFIPFWTQRIIHAWLGLIQRSTQSSETTTTPPPRRRRSFRFTANTDSIKGSSEHANLANTDRML